ncbi:hypothetical protein HK105_209250 [Polyrhizophydium stewartii]|uniref:Mini-chromosome maintenance complex-binding protein n=1 Tax=Polyrhizophydium stewartii TaxID=2732419 RepID=A0ABR4MVK1_9FUNG
MDTLIERPLDAIQDLLAAHAKIPVLSKATQAALPDRSLVRLRCFVQDNGLSFEAFPLECNVHHASTGEQLRMRMMYMDAPQHPWELHFDDAAAATAGAGTTFGEKHPHFCLGTVPAETPWARGLGAAPTTDDELAGAMAHLAVGERGAALFEKLMARKLGCGGSLPSEAHAVVVKTYAETDQLRLHDVVEVVGILEKQPVEIADEDDLADYSLFELLPRVHALLVEKLEGVKINPLTRRSAIPGSLSSAFDVAALREAAISHIQSSLLGDRLAAEYMLLQLFSRITSRMSYFPVGYFPLNLCRAPRSAGFASNLASALFELVPHGHLLPMTLGKLNSELWISPDQTRNASSADSDIGLGAGLLQMPTGTVVVVDETQLATGTLVDRGVRNLQALRNTIQNAQLMFDLGFGSTMERPVDLRFVVVSEGKSMFPDLCTLPLEADPDAASDAAAGASAIRDPATLDAVRALIEFAKAGNPVLSSEMEQRISAEFVDTRAAQRASNQVVDDGSQLLLRLNVAQLLEDARRARLERLRTSSQAAGPKPAPDPAAGAAAQARSPSR